MEENVIKRIEAETKLNILTDWLADKVIKDRAVFKDDIEEILNALGYEVIYDADGE